MHLRRRIDLFLRRSRMSPTTFGREAINDPRLMHDLNNGRELREKTVERIVAWLDARDPKR